VKKIEKLSKYKAHPIIMEITSAKLNKLQQRAYDAVITDKQNIFITGAAGVGKSFIIKKLKHDLELVYFRNVALTSTTGISAQIIGGVTLFSYLGIQLGTKPLDILIQQIRKNIFMLNRWRRISVLIIDEISMLSMELFEKLNKLAQELRNNNKPFGGIQLVLSGDYLQLPSVGRDDFLFESSIWKQCIQETIYLAEIIRQSDEIFIRILNKIRLGIVDDEVRTVLQSREIKYTSDVGLIPTMLYATNAKVDAANTHYYDKLKTEEYTYELKRNWFKRTAYPEKYDSMIRFKEKLSLKVGAQVMHLVNSNGLVNGSRGIVTNIIEGLPMVLFDNGAELMISPVTLDMEENGTVLFSYTQLPLTLAWSATIHKSQGSTLTLARIDFKRAFEFGQLYVALSRVKSLDGLYIRNLDFDVIKASPKAVKYYKDLDDMQ
jgi:ATP-dependent DNA helicase PIF1